MSVSNYIKQNFALFLGIALPVLLVVAFMVIAHVPKTLGPAPEHAVLFTLHSGKQGSAYNVDYVVKKGKLYARLTEPKNDYGHYRQELYVFNAKTSSLKKIEPELPADIKPDQQRDVLVDEFAEAKINNDSRSPDGFTLENGSYRSRGIMGDIFGGGSYRYESGLRHDSGYTYTIKAGAGYNTYDNITFIGWVE